MVYPVCYFYSCSFASGPTLVQVISLDVQVMIIEKDIACTPAGGLGSVLQKHSRLSQSVRRMILTKAQIWRRLGTNFDIEILQRAINLVIHTNPPSWNLTFWNIDKSKPQWHRLAGLIHNCTSLTINSSPVRYGIPRSINDLSMLPHPPCPLTTLALVGFRVSPEPLLETLSQNHICLQSLQLILQRVESFPRVYELPNLSVLHVAGSPWDIRLFGEHLTAQSLSSLVIEPRGRPNDIERGPTPHIGHLRSILSLTIKGNMSWVVVNRYLTYCRSLISMELVFLQIRDANAILSDLALRAHSPHLPRSLRNISVSPVDCIQTVAHLLPLIKAANASLDSLVVGLHTPSQMQLRGVIQIPVTLPGRVTSSDNLEIRGGEGEWSSDANAWGNNPGAHGWGESLEESDSYLWYE